MQNNMAQQVLFIQHRKGCLAQHFCEEPTLYRFVTKLTNFITISFFS